MTRDEKLDIARGAIEDMRQIAEKRWGTKDKHPADWLAILVEEVGEVAKACNEQDADGLFNELAQVASVCINMMVEQLK